MRISPLLVAVLAVAALSAPAALAAPRYEPDEVIVKYRDGTSADERAELERETGTDAAQALAGGSRQLAIEDGESVRETVAELRGDPDVAYAVPNYVARLAAFPNDPGYRLQWNFRGPPTFGIGMPEAWTLARSSGVPGGRGTVVAVLDTGVAYRRFGRRLRRVPDLNRFVRGYDFVDDDRFPLDFNGHGTHVAGTVAQTTNNRRGASGIAYRARIMPLRVLDPDGFGTSFGIASAIRFAVRNRAHVINLSVEFDSKVRSWHIPDIVAAIRFARSRGVTVIAAAGNTAGATVAYPARAPGVIAVAATTHTGCEADYSNAGADVDLAAPGGGADAPNSDNAWDATHCVPRRRGRFIYQQTFRNQRLLSFGLPGGYEGTSMAAPHVSGIAALVIASRRLGRKPSPWTVEQHLKATARDLGPPGFDTRYGHGLVDAAAALRPAP